MRWEKKAWDYNDNSWSLCYGRIEHGIDSKEGRRLLTREIQKPLPFEDGTFLTPRVTMIDSGGGWTIHVYKFCARFNQPIVTPGQRLSIQQGHNVVVPYKGSNNLEATKTIMKMDRIKRKIGSSVRSDHRLFTVGATKVKLEAYRAFNTPAEIAREGNGRAMFRDDYDESYYGELTSEKIKSKLVSGKRVLYFEDPPSGMRNESLDTHVLNCAAAAILKEARKERSLVISLAAARGKVVRRAQGSGGTGGY